MYETLEQNSRLGLVQMNVVILAAGKGRRYNAKAPPEYQTLTKCLLPLNGETILARQLRLLTNVGLTDVTVVVPPEFPFSNYDTKYLVDTLPNFPTSTTWSVRKCTHFFKRSGTMILMGDAVFPESTLHEILTKQYNDILFVVTQIPVAWTRIKGENVPSRYGLDEGYMVLLRDNGVDKFTKYLATAPTQDGRGIHYIAGKMRNVELYYPKGYIRDVDTWRELEEVKDWINKSKE